MKYPRKNNTPSVYFALPHEYFGITERFSVFAATGFNAVLGVFLFLGFNRLSFLEKNQIVNMK